jgi:tRNA (guanine10-N2)-methyltransferase
MEVWGEGSTWEELQESIEACPSAIKDPWLKEDIKFKIVIETYGWKLGDDNHKDCIQKLQFIPFQASVDPQGGVT